MSEINQDSISMFPLLLSTSNSFASKESISKLSTPSFSFTTTPVNENKLFDNDYSNNNKSIINSPEINESYHQPPRPPNLMNDWEIGGTQNAWVCPSDRHLQLRAQLKSGWSVRTSKIKSPTTSKSQPSGITEEEQEQIRKVLERAEQGRLNEQIRIGKMVERLENLKARATGNGVTQCLLCTAEFGLFTSKSYAAMCNDCRKYVCQRSCGVDTFDQKKMEPIFLCKVCSEYREVMLKKSGAWFYKELPTFVRSSPSAEEQEPNFLRYTSKAGETSRRKIEQDLPISNGRLGKSCSPNRGVNNKQLGNTPESFIGNIPNFMKETSSRPRIQPSWIKEKPVTNSSFNSEATHTSSEESEDEKRVGYSKKGGRRQYRPKDFIQKQSYIPESLSQPPLGIPKYSKGNINKEKQHQRAYDSGNTKRGKLIISFIEDSDNDYCRRSTPSTSPRHSLATPSSFGGDDFSQNPTTVVSNDYPLDNKSIDSGVVQSDHSNQQSNTLSSSVSGVEFPHLSSPCHNEAIQQSNSLKQIYNNSSETSKNYKGSSYPVVTGPQQTANGTYVLPSSTNSLSQNNYNFNKYSSLPKTSTSYCGNNIILNKYQPQQRSSSATPSQSPRHYLNNSQNIINNNNSNQSTPKIPPRPPSTPSINLAYNNNTNNIRSSSTSSSASSLIQRKCSEGNSVYDNMLPNHSSSFFTLDPVIEVKSSTAVTPNAEIPENDTIVEKSVTPVFMSDQEGEDVLGSVQFELTYYSKEKKLVIHLISARNLKAMDSNGFSDPYVKFHLIPGNMKATKLTSKTIEKTLNPNWDEELVYYGVTEKEKQMKTLRITVLDRDRIGSDFLGEVRVLLRKLQNGVTQKFNLYLDSAMRSNNPCEVSNVPLIRGKILIGICYNFSQGNLIVNIKRCSELIGMDSSGFSDPYCKITLLPATHKSHRRRTTIKKKTLNPEFDESFDFVIPYKELPTKALQVKVYDHDVAKHDDFIGGIVLSTAAEGERGIQWRNCIENANQFFEQWHELEKEV
uniref:Rabphilin n=1 Tax=Parastrongyloides trichosuri TaxID=131310 RepID=A0A0N4ZME4_PARTI